jgi:hypothetical protein
MLKRSIEVIQVEGYVPSAAPPAGAEARHGQDSRREGHRQHQPRHGHGGRHPHSSHGKSHGHSRPQHSQPKPASGSHGAAAAPGAATPPKRRWSGRPARFTGR